MPRAAGALGPLVLVAFLVALVAVMLAWALARSSAIHTTIAAVLSVGFVADVLRAFLVVRILGPAHVTGGLSPLSGFPLAIAHLDTVLFLAWPAALAAAGLVAFLGRTRVALAVLAAYAADAVVVALEYPWSRGQALLRVYGAAEAVGVAFVGLAWAVRTLCAGPSERRLSTAQSALLLILPFEILATIGLWNAQIGLSSFASSAMFAALAVQHVRWLRNLSPARGR